jgi:hypothetical protein
MTHQHSSWAGFWASLLADKPEGLGVNMLPVGEGESIQQSHLVKIFYQSHYLKVSRALPCGKVF